jgi:hypothetical protein
VANRIGAESNLNPVFIILLAHQYIDADPVMRVMYKERWLAFTVQRSPYALAPESYIPFLKATYFPAE